MRSLARATLAVIAITAISAASCGAPLPNVVRDELARSPRGTATIVFFTDFQCPYCRRTHAALAPILDERKDKVRLVLKHVPLRGHPNARDAARADVCVEELGGTDASLRYARSLFTSLDLSKETLEDMASAVGVDRDRYRACVADRATDERIAADEKAFDAADGDGVPLLFVGRSRLEGEQSRSSLEAAIDEATEK